MTSQHKNGFTLLEVMIAMVIAALSLAVLFQAIGQGVAQTRAARHYAEALSRARSHMAAIDRDVTKLVGTHEGDDGGGYVWRVDIRPIAGESGGSGFAVYECVVSESWGDPPHQIRVVLKTRRLGTTRAHSVKSGGS